MTYDMLIVVSVGNMRIAFTEIGNDSIWCFEQLPFACSDDLLLKLK